MELKKLLNATGFEWMTATSIKTGASMIRQIMWIGKKPKEKVVLSGLEKIEVD